MGCSPHAAEGRQFKIREERCNVARRGRTFTGIDAVLPSGMSKSSAKALASSGDSCSSLGQSSDDLAACQQGPACVLAASAVQLE